MMQAATSWRASRRHGVAMAALLCVLAALSFPSGGSPAAAPIAVAVADFGYFDSSRELADQSAGHRARVGPFAKILRGNLAAPGDFSGGPVQCPHQPRPPTS